MLNFNLTLHGTHEGAQDAPENQSVLFGRQGVIQSSTVLSNVALRARYSIGAISYVDTISAHQKVRIWQTNPGDTDAANIYAADHLNNTWVLFLLANHGTAEAAAPARLYLCKQEQWDQIEVDYPEAGHVVWFDRNGWRRSFPRGCISPIINYLTLLYGTTLDVATSPASPSITPAVGDGGSALPEATLGHIEGMATTQTHLLYSNSLDGCVRWIDLATGRVRVDDFGLSYLGTPDAVVDPNIVNPAMNGPYYGYLDTYQTVPGMGILPDGVGGYYACDTKAGAIYYVNSGGGVTTFAGTPDPIARGGADSTYNGDGHSAADTLLSYPTSICFSADRQSLYVADTGDALILKMPLDGGPVTTICGNGLASSSGSLGVGIGVVFNTVSSDPAHPTLALECAAGFCTSLNLGRGGRYLYFLQGAFGLVNRIDLTNGTVSRVVGPYFAPIDNIAGVVRLIEGYIVDGTPVHDTQGRGIMDMTIDRCDNIIFVDYYGVIHRTDKGGRIHALAGQYGGSASAIAFADGEQPALSRRLGFPGRICRGHNIDYFYAENDSAFNEPSLNSTIGRIHRQGK